MNAQEVFDTVAKHLITQGRQAYNSHPEAMHCVYRASNGDKCAVGIMITDEEYEPCMEGNNLEGVMEDMGLLKHLKPFYPLLTDLQGVHDDVSNTVGYIPDPEGRKWKDKSTDHTFDLPKLRSALSEVAKTHNLEFSYV